MCHVAVYNESSTWLSSERDAYDTCLLFFERRFRIIRVFYIRYAYGSSYEYNIFICLTHLAPKATELGKIAQINHHYTVQGHSRSPILVSIENPYATLY